MAQFKCMGVPLRLNGLGVVLFYIRGCEWGELVDSENCKVEEAFKPRLVVLTGHHM